MALTVERARVPDGAANLQAWARDVRYGAAARRALRRGARVAAGHTATDQAETILHRLAASPGRRALLGMPARDGLLVRPLLDLEREETAAYCRARGLAWREDASNELGSSSSYTRARVRHETLPALRAVHPAAEANLVRTAALLRDEAEVLETLVDGVLEGRDRIETARLAALSPALRRLVARRLAEDAAGRLVPEAAGRAAELAALGGGEARHRSILAADCGRWSSTACCASTQGVASSRRRLSSWRCPEPCASAAGTYAASRRPPSRWRACSTRLPWPEA